MTAVKDWQRAADLIGRTGPRPWGLLLIDHDAGEEAVAIAWVEGSKGTGYEEAQTFVATPHDISDLGIGSSEGGYKVPLVVVAFSRAHTRLHHQMVEYVEEHYPLVKYTAVAQVALGAEQ